MSVLLVILPVAVTRCESGCFAFLPSIFRTTSQAVLREVLLLTVETKLYHDVFLACLMMRFAIARSRLYSSKCALSGLAKNALRAFFLLLIARLHASLNQGFFGLFFDFKPIF